MDDFRITPNGLAFSCWISNEYVQWFRWCIAFPVHTYWAFFEFDVELLWKPLYTESERIMHEIERSVCDHSVDAHRKICCRFRRQCSDVYAICSVGSRVCCYVMVWVGWCAMYEPNNFHKSFANNTRHIYVYLVEKCLLFEACSHSSQQFFNVYSITSDLSVEFAVLWFLSNRIAFKLKCKQIY